MNHLSWSLVDSDLVTEPLCDISPMLSAQSTTKLKEELCMWGLVNFPVVWVLLVSITNAGTQLNIMGLKVGLH